MSRQTRNTLLITLLFSITARTGAGISEPSSAGGGRQWDAT